MLNLFFILSELHNAAYANEISRELAYTGATRYTDAEDIFIGYETAPVAEAFVDAYRLQGIPEALMRGKYEKLQAIADRNAAIGAGLDIYADVMTTGVHRSLFDNALFLILTESILFAILTALYSLGYEHQNKTEMVVYGTKTGRHIALHKKAAALTAAACGFALIAAFTLAIYFAVWDFSGFWNANVSGMMNYIVDEAGFRPFITWVSLTVAEYLAAVLALSFSLTLVFSLIGSLAGLLARNTYIGFMAVILLCMLMMVSVYFFRGIGFGWGAIVSLFSPVAVWYSHDRWLTDMGSFGYIPFHETVAILGNFVLFALFAFLATRRFLRKDVL